MRLRVQYTAQIRAAANKSEDEVELPDGSNLAVLIDHLTVRLGREAAVHLVTSSGEPHRSLLIIVNESLIASTQTSATVLRTGDVVTFLPPIAGG